MDKSKKYSLDGTWELAFTMPDEGNVVKTTVRVPCNVEPTLVELGLVEEYQPCTKERAMEKFESVDDWTYVKVFDKPDLQDGWKQEIVFEGIDTIADIYLNGELVCDCCNMHLCYRVDVAGKLKEKGNELKVVIHSSELWARKHKHDMFSISRLSYDSQAHLRKARHQWGWDNAPRLITSGIYRSVYIEESAPCRFEEVYLCTSKITEEKVHLEVVWSYETPETYLGDHSIRFTLLEGEKVVFQDSEKIRFVQSWRRYQIDRDKVKLWWPAGFGEPKLYTVRLEMLKGEERAAVYEAPFGLRTLTLERTEDILEDGTGEFVFRVNGEKVFIRGTNWKPLDSLGSLADKKTREGRALEEVKNLNCNMVRIWGGGIYEDEAFFDYCDQNGIMVWQDFMFACEVPCTDEEYNRLVANEAEYIIKKQRNHPSLAVWCGDNENDECVMWVQYGSHARPSDSVITRKILKEAVLHHDPYRSYVDSSPYASDTNYEQKRSKMTHFQPEMHLYPHPALFAEKLRECRSKFIGETGPMDVNSITVNDRIFEKEKERAARLWDAPKILPLLQHHQNDSYFVKWRITGRELCEAAYGRDFTFAEWKDYTLAINTACAEVFKDVIEYSRVVRWSKTGVIWWSLMDMWPMLFNYSVIDCDFNRKLGYHWIKQSQQEFILAGVRTESNGELALYAANDTLHAVTAQYSVTAYDEDGRCRTIATGICRQEKNSSGLIQRIAESDRPKLWIIRWIQNGRESVNHVMTGNVSIEVTRKWVEIIGKEYGIGDQILELK